MSPGQEERERQWESLLLNGTTQDLPEGLVLPVMVNIRQWNGSTGWREKRAVIRTVEGHVRKCLLQADQEGACLQLDETHLLAILTMPLGQGEVWARCQDVLGACGEALMCEVSCCIGEQISGDGLGKQVDRIYALEEATVSNCPILQLEQTEQGESVPPELLEQWRYLLQDGNFDPLLMKVERYFQETEKRLDAASLHRFNQDFLQMLYGFMAEKQVPAHVLFDRRENVTVFRDATVSIGNTVTWIFAAITALSVHLERRRSSQNYTQQAKNYILEHLGDSFTRQDIAEDVHLSQNHLARLFRQETGMSISEYILQERMKLAFNLLKNTGLSVGEEALRAGYENYSYFLTLFRRVAGMTPSQYREKYNVSLGGDRHE